VSRAGAAPGDVLAITLSSAQGQPPQGLGARWAAALVPCLSRAERDIITSLTDGDVAFSNFGLPVELMQAAVRRGLVTSAMDTSDGVLACAQLLGDASDVGFELYPDAIDAMINDDARRLALKLGVAPFLFALNGGHDWEIVFTAPSDQVSELDGLARRDESRFPAAAIIGRVVKRAVWAKAGVRLRIAGASQAVLPYFTGEKFRSRTSGPRARDWLDFARHATRMLHTNGYMRDTS
jgi:thiamine monophosphate kinase